MLDEAGSQQRGKGRPVLCSSSSLRTRIFPVVGEGRVSEQAGAYPVSLGRFKAQLESKPSASHLPSPAFLVCLLSSSHKGSLNLLIPSLQKVIIFREVKSLVHLSSWQVAGAEFEPGVVGLQV